MVDQQPTPTESAGTQHHPAIAPQDLSPQGRALLVEIMRERVEKISAEIARLDEERRQTVEWLAANDATAQKQGGEQA